MKLKTKLAAGALLAGLIPVVGVEPANASYKNTDAETSQITFHFNGQQLTCRAGGSSSYEFPRPDGSDTAHIEALSGVYDDPGCRNAIFEVSLDGRYETAPGSG